MTDQSLSLPKFSLTAAAPCPYRPGQQERKIFTELFGPGAQGLNDTLTATGFRRSQNVAYRPACEACEACVSVRVPVASFVPSRSQQRVLSRNRTLSETFTEPVVDEEQFLLIRQYLESRHADGGMADMDLMDYANMVEASPVKSFLAQYRLPPSEENDFEGRLVAVCLADFLHDGLSLIYSFFDPALSARSLGTLMVLGQIGLAARLSLPYVYLGYWIEDCRKMAYKNRFRPLEFLGPEGWRPMPETTKG